jgi:hypothetical protein
MLGSQGSDAIEIEDSEPERARAVPFGKPRWVSVLVASTV